MLNIFNYLDYREFPDDFYTEKKARQSGFSFQVMAQMAGFKSKSYLKHVIDGKKNLSEISTEQLNKILKLNEKSFSYFKALVAFNQAKTLQLRNYYFEQLQRFSTRNASKLLQEQHYAYFAQWYHSTIREIITKINFHDDYDLLGSLLCPPISSRKARQSVMLLEKLGLIKKEGDRFISTDVEVTTGDEVRSLAVQNFHLQNLHLAGDSISLIPSAERDISTLIVGMSPNQFSKVKSEIQGFRKKILRLVTTDEKADRIYHINFQLFPTSRSLDEK